MCFIFTACAANRWGRQLILYCHTNHTQTFNPWRVLHRAACLFHPASQSCASLHLPVPPAPYPFGRRHCVLLLFKRNHRLLRFWAVNHSAHYIAYCLSYSPSFCVHLNCVCRYQLQPLIHTERRLIHC